MEIERLVGGPFPIINEAHGEWRTGQGVSERLREGQRRAALERLRHSGAIRRALRVRGVRRLKCDPRLSEQLAVALEAHQHGDLRARARLLDRRLPAVEQRGLQLVERIDLGGGAPRRRDHQHPAGNSLGIGHLVVIVPIALPLKAKPSPVRRQHARVRLPAENAGPSGEASRHQHELKMTTSFNKRLTTSSPGE
jgi:hypothetical protein